MTQREKIVDRVSQMIKAVGVKSVRMDDVASDLGMSKRTLYEMFGDKEELLSESILYMMEQRQKDIYEKVAGCDNMVEVLLRSVRLVPNVAECEVALLRVGDELLEVFLQLCCRAICTPFNGCDCAIAEGDCVVFIIIGEANGVVHDILEHSVRSVVLTD